MSAGSPVDPDADLQSLVRRLEALELANSECFLCANSITAGHYTLEHVVPTWAQRRYNLWDQRLSFLNGTYIPYTRGRGAIPCGTQTLPRN